MTVREDFEQLYGKERAIQVIAKASDHSDMSTTPLPKGEDKLLCFSLLKMVDFQCFNYGDSCDLTEEQIKQFLIKHKKVAKKCPVTTYLGLFSGAFDFLTK